ncbi:RF-1 domain-containing protein [Trametes punicea]|nr:RF-1 domain-containing protein [Trametes punicea]
MQAYGRVAPLPRAGRIISWPTLLARASHWGRQTLPLPPSLPVIQDASQSAEAKAWIDQFKAAQIPKNLVELTFSRSSGPGGQNVNKVNTKATLRCSIHEPWIPPWARDYIKKTPSYVSSSQSILLTSTVHRSQAQNVQECLAKLHSLVVSAASAGLVNEPSEEQRERVRSLERAEKARRRLEKDKRKQIKRGRSGGGDWD